MANLFVYVELNHGPALGDVVNALPNHAATVRYRTGDDASVEVLIPKVKAALAKDVVVVVRGHGGGRSTIYMQDAWNWCKSSLFTALSQNKIPAGELVLLNCFAGHSLSQAAANQDTQPMIHAYGPAGIFSSNGVMVHVDQRPDFNLRDALSNRRTLTQHGFVGW